MLLIRYAVMKPFLSLIGDQHELIFEFQLSVFEFFLLVLSVLLIAAGGYLHNNILDYRTDKLNKKNRTTYGHYSELIYYCLSLTGLGIGFSLGYVVGNFYLGIIQLVSVASLWFYNVSLKGIPLVGNLVIAFLTALVPITLGIYEVPLLNSAYMDKELYELGFNFNVISYWTLGFGAFAFLLTLLRELVKDMEDVEGDQKSGIATLAVIGGVKVTKMVYYLVSFITVYSIYWVVNHLVNDYMSIAFGGVIELVVFTCLFLVFKAKSSSGFKYVSILLKVISVLGLLYSVVVYTILNSLL